MSLQERERGGAIASRSLPTKGQFDRSFGYKAQMRQQSLFVIDQFHYKNKHHPTLTVNTTTSFA